MRREYMKSGGDTPLPPFPENLVFWAPLTQGDLSDHISGEVGVSSSGCSATWDSGEGMYLLSAATPRMNVLVDGARLRQSQIDTTKLWKVAVAYNPSARQLTYYNNGVYMTTYSWTETPAAPLSVGLCSKNGHGTSTTSGYNTKSFSAYVQDVRIYNRQLTVSEIAQL